MPEKVWNVKCEKAEDINDSEYSRIDSDFLSEFEKFEKIYEVENNKNHERVLELRGVLKAGFETCGTYSDETKGKPLPPVQKEFDNNFKMIELPEPDEKVLIKPNLFQCIKDRESRRGYSDEHLTIDELSYLLWATQGVRGFYRNNTITTRTVPSGGARQPFETYLSIHNVEGIEPGVYYYQPLNHRLVYLFTYDDLQDRLTDSAFEQSFAGSSAVCFIWSTIPYKCEWRYTTEAKKIIAQDSGHLCQNLYLAAESINCGTCAIGAYNQKKMDSFIKLDGIDEFVVYMSPVGKQKTKSDKNN